MKTIMITATDEDGIVLDKVEMIVEDDTKKLLIRRVHKNEWIHGDDPTLLLK